MKLKHLLILLVLIPFNAHADFIEFYNGYLYSELKSQFSHNTNLANNFNEGFQQAEFNARLNFTEQFKGYAFFETGYSEFTWGRDTRYFNINSYGLKYQFDPVTGVKLGSLFVNYSPYIIAAFPWFTATFRGLQFNLDRSDLTFNAFIANNQDTTIESSSRITSQINIVSNVVQYHYDSINLGDNNKANPTIWVAFTFAKHLPEQNYFNLN